MNYPIEYSVERVYQHQSGQAFAVVKIIVFGQKATDLAQEQIEASLPLHDIEKRVQAYVREVLSSRLIKNVKASVEI